MKKKITVKEHKEGLIDLYMDQLNHKSDTTFMKSVLFEAIRLLTFETTDPKKVENWVVQQDKKSISLTL